MKIPIKDIKLSPYQVRDLEQDPDLAALAESIKEHGQLQPIKLRPMERAFECVFGHRRLEAVRLAGFETVEAIVADATDKEVQIQALIENTQRKDLEELELAEAEKALADAAGWSDAELARHIGKSAPEISRTLALLDETEEVQQLLRPVLPRVRPLTERHIREARAVLPDAEVRKPVLGKAAQESLTSEQTRKLAERYRDAGTPEEKKRVLEIPAKKQEAVEILIEDVSRAEKRAKAIKGEEVMTPTDYLAKLQSTERLVDKLLLGGRQVEIWRSNTWPLIWGCFQRMSESIDEFLQEVTEDAEQDNG